MILLRIFCLLLIATSVQSARPSKKSGLACSFRRDFCLWRNVASKKKMDDFNWKWGRGGRANVLNGQVTDHTKEHGGFAYIKTTTTNRTAILTSPLIISTSGRCLSFWYHMNGSNVGHLAVKMVAHRSRDTTGAIWQLQGHQTTEWSYAKVLLPPMQNAHLLFEAFDRASGKDGNIAIDDVALPTITYPNSCGIYPLSARPSSQSRTTTAKSSTIEDTTTQQPTTEAPTTTTTTTKATTTTKKAPTTTTTEASTTQAPTTTTTQATTTTKATTTQATTTTTQATTTTTERPTTTEATTTTTTIATTEKLTTTPEPTTSTRTTQKATTTTATTTTTTESIVEPPAANLTKLQRNSDKNTKTSGNNQSLMISGAVLVPVLAILLLCYLVRRRRQSRLSKLVNLDDGFTAMDMGSIHKKSAQESSNNGGGGESTTYSKLTDNYDM